MSVSDFTGKQMDFAVGSVFGLRSWGIDEDGRLHGVTHREVWRPGINLSVCKATRSVPCPDRDKKKPVVDSDHRRLWGGKRNTDPGSYFLSYGSLPSASPPCGKDVTCTGENHQAPSGHLFDPDCKCGFWAYDEQGFQGHGPVVGVIEAFGKVTIGTKGFRAEKARIVGLSQESEDDELTLSERLRLTTLYDVPLYETLDDLVRAFPGVQKQWSDETADDFWTKPLASRDGYWTQYSTSLMGPTLTTADMRRIFGINP